MTGQGFQDYKALPGRRRHSYNRDSTSETTDSCIFREHWNGFHEAILGSRIVTRDSSFVQSTWPWGIYDPLFPNVSETSIFQYELDGNLCISTSRYQMIMNHVQDRDEFEDNTARLTFLQQVPAILRRWRGGASIRQILTDIEIDSVRFGGISENCEREQVFESTWTWQRWIERPRTSYRRPLRMDGTKISH